MEQQKRPPATTDGQATRPERISMNNNSLQLFEYQNKMIRTIAIDGEAWFVAKDVCDLLDITNIGNVMARLPNAMKGIHTVDTLGGPQQMSVVNEAGVYKLSFTSRKPEAEAFTDFVAGTILPSIRKHGAYMTPETIESILINPDVVIQLATRLKEHQAEIAAQNQYIKALEPKAEFYDAVAGSKDAISIGDMAKVLAIRGIGRNNLFSILRDKKILDERNVPYQAFVDRGYFRVVEQKYTKVNGETKINLKTLVYQRGLDFVRKTVSA